MPDLSLNLLRRYRMAGFYTDQRRGFQVQSRDPMGARHWPVELLSQRFCDLCQWRVLPLSAALECTRCVWRSLGILTLPLPNRADLDIEAILDVLTSFKVSPQADGVMDTPAPCQTHSAESVISTSQQQASVGDAIEINVTFHNTGCACAGTTQVLPDGRARTQLTCSAAPGNCTGRPFSGCAARRLRPSHLFAPGCRAGKRHALSHRQL